MRIETSQLRHLCDEAPARVSDERGTFGRMNGPHIQWTLSDSTVPISFCPFCGKELPQHITSLEALDKTPDSGKT